MLDGYSVFRQDRIGRDKRSGGVLIFMKNKIICSHQPNLTTNCEIIWIKLEIAGSEPLYIDAYYRPHESDLLSLEELGKSLKLVSQNKGTIWLAGDFNFPTITWEDQFPRVCGIHVKINIYMIPS